MNLHEALLYLEKGGKVRRSDWPQGMLYIYQSNLDKKESHPHYFAVCEDDEVADNVHLEWWPCERDDIQKEWGEVKDEGM